MTTLSNAPEPELDPITLEILWARSIAIADEMLATLVRTAFSTVIRVNIDCATAIFDDRGTMLAQPSNCAPGHIACMPGVMQTLLETYPAEELAEGDALITNDPWIGAGHTPDVYIAAPVFVAERLIGFAVTVAHHIDFGGRVAPTDSKDVYEEGLLLPIMKLYRRGVPNADVFSIIEGNVRMSDKIMGDLDAQRAANALGQRRLIELVEEYDLHDLRGLASSIVSTTERSMRKRIQDMGDGVWRRTESLELTDDAGEKLSIEIEIRVEGDEITFDYAGTSSQVALPINCVRNYTMSYSVLGLKFLLAPDLPYNEGVQRPVHLSIPEANLLNARFPAPVRWRIAVGQQLPEIVMKTIATAAPDQVIAGSGSTPMWLWLFSGWRPGGRRFVFQTHFMGGLGARASKDGIATAAFPFNMSDTPVEVLENECPVIVHERSLVPDSGGAGRFRGGLGQRIVLSPSRPESNQLEGPLTISFSAGRLATGPHGVDGGHAAAPGRIEVNGSAQSSVLDTVTVGHDDTVVIQLPGGGGFHPPTERDPARLRDDVLNGYVTLESAREHYGMDAESLLQGDGV